MEDLLSRFQSTRVSYELKAEEAEVIRAKFNAASSSAYNPARSLSGPLHLNITAQSAKEFRLWKVSAVFSPAPVFRPPPADLFFCMHFVTAAHGQLLCMQDKHPSILEQFEEFAKLVRGKRLAVFLDYDGKH